MEHDEKGAAEESPAAPDPAAAETELPRIPVMLEFAGEPQLKTPPLMVGAGGLWRGLREGQIVCS